MHLAHPARYDACLALRGLTLATRCELQQASDGTLGCQRQHPQSLVPLADGSQVLLHLCGAQHLQGKRILVSGSQGPKTQSKNKQSSICHPYNSNRDAMQCFAVLDTLAP